VSQTTAISALLEQNFRLETSLRCIISRFANLGDLDEISQ